MVVAALDPILSLHNQVHQDLPYCTDCRIPACFSSGSDISSDAFEWIGKKQGERVLFRAHPVFNIQIPSHIGTIGLASKFEYPAQRLCKTKVRERFLRPYFRFASFFPPLNAVLAFGGGGPQGRWGPGVMDETLLMIIGNVVLVDDWAGKNGFQA